MTKHFLVSEFSAFARGVEVVRPSSPMSSFLPTLKLLYATSREDFSTRTAQSHFTKALKVLAASRVVLFPREMREYHELRIAEKFQETLKTRDRLYFARHKYHLSKKFTLRQRVRAAVDHHAFEAARFGRDYAQRVYRSEGILLWERMCDDHRFAMTLAASEDNRHEGELSVVLSVDGVRLQRLSFSYLNNALFAAGGQYTLMITRNQSYRPPEKKLFELYFKQNSTQLFSLAALGGLAAANEFPDVLAIRHDAQIAYETSYDAGFRNSYSGLWEKYGAVEVDASVYRLRIPLETRPLDEVSASHRNRARNRRAHWDEIRDSAQRTLRGYRVG